MTEAKAKLVTELEEHKETCTGNFLPRFCNTHYFSIYTGISNNLCVCVCVCVCLCVV